MTWKAGASGVPVGRFVDLIGILVRFLEGFGLGTLVGDTVGDIVGVWVGDLVGGTVGE